MSDYDKYQRKLLHLTINNQELTEDFIANTKPEYFSIKYRPMAIAVRLMHIKGSVLTKNSYMDLIVKSCENGKYKEWTESPDTKFSKNMVAIAESTIFSELASTESANKSDFNFYIEKLKEHYVREEANRHLVNYQKTAKSDVYKASAELAESLKSLAGEADAGVAKVIDGAEFGADEWLKNLERRRTQVDKRLLTGFPEIDHCINVGLKPGMLTLFVADVGGFKCAGKDELVQIGSGEYISAQELYERYNNGKDLSLLSLGSNQRIYKQSVLHVMDNGIQPCYRVTTKSGQTSVMTGNHPYLTFNGYKRLDELEVGQHVAIARVGVFGETDPGPDVPTWLGCMIADGGSSRSNYTFSNIDYKIVRNMRKTCRSLDIRFKRRSKLRRGDYSVSNNVRSLGKKYQIDGKLSIHKSICREIYTWNKDSLSRMLAAMYGCDGTFRYEEASKKKKVQVIYHTSSEQLAIDVRNLLLKFGIISSIRSHMSSYIRKDGSKHERLSYRVYIRNTEECALFIRQIGFLGEKQERAKEWLQRFEVGDFVGNPNLDIIPNDVIPLVRSKFVNGKTEHGCRRFLKGEEANRSNSPPIFDSRNKGVGRSKLRKIAEYLNNDKELLDICGSDIFWDEIASIEYVGEDQTYDIAMPVDHNFVANNFITHNTTMMLNVAINMFKQYGENVLFIPLEMPAEQLFHKVVARESKVELRKIEHADKLTDVEFEKVKREVEKWEEFKNNFVMFDPINKLRVSDIRKLIEKNYAWFKPKVVVVDYVSLLRPEAIHERAPTHEQVGHMCKDLRQLGRSMGFTVISAAQLSRDAIKKLRKEKEGQQTLGSEDVRGSHDFSADSDNIFAQIPMPSQPNEKLQIFCIKARYGSKTFAGGKPYAVLNVAPEMGRISSEEDATWECLTADRSVQHAESLIDNIDMGADLDFGDEDDNSPPVSRHLSTDEIFSEKKSKDSNLNVLMDDFE